MLHVAIMLESSISRMTQRALSSCLLRCFRKVSQHLCVTKFRFFLVPVLVLFVNLSESSNVFSQGGSWEVDSAKGAFRRTDPAVIAYRHKLYVFGFAAAQSYDPALHRWDSLPILESFGATDLFIGSRSTFGALFGNSIFIISEYTKPGTGCLYRDTALVFDPATNVMTAIADSGVHIPRDHFAAVQVGHEIAVIGGAYYTDPGCSTFVYTPWIDYFDVVSHKWRESISKGFFYPRETLSACVLNNKIYTFGGRDYLASSCTSCSRDTVNVLDVGSNTWTSPQMSGVFHRRAQAACAVLDGKIYLLGGFTEGSRPTYGSTSCQVFDPQTNRWDSIASLPYAIEAGSACAMDGKIYVIGGEDDGSPVLRVQIFTPGPASVTTSAPADVFALVPNPATSTIRLTQLPTLRQAITVTNLLGQQVMSIDAHDRTSIPLDVSSLPAGPYFVQLVTNTGIETRKFVKE
jgi:hypothetical protein